VGRVGEPPGRPAPPPLVMGPCEAEVSQPRIHLAIEKDIAGLDIPMDDNLFRVLVEVEKARRDTLDDVEPLRPA